MIVLKNPIVGYFDVDQTLILENTLAARKVFSKLIEIKNNGVSGKYWPHSGHIAQLKAHRVRGHGVVVWSKGGPAWAARVIKALRLEKFVDLVIAKPSWIFDDKDPSKWIHEVYYLPYE